MRLVTFADRTVYGPPRFGILHGGDVVDVVAAAQALARPVPATSVKSALTSGPATLAALAEIVDLAGARGIVRPSEGVTFLPPLLDPSKFLCIGKNTREHREELIAHGMLTEQPKEPTGFIKLVDTMVGDGAPVVRPDGITSLDYEPELVFVIGKRAHGVSKADAPGYVAGFTLFNDVTAREVQKREVQSGTRFWTAKNMPGFAPIGPFVCTMDEVADPFDLWLTCHVNGEPRLRESTADYIYRIDDVIAHFSRAIVLEPGDLVAMGAPKGTAMSRPNAAELFLKPGDRMEIGLEGVMTLRTDIVAP